MTRWGNLKLSLCTSVALLGLVGTSQAELLTFQVIPAFAPKGPESPSWNNYVLNAIAGIQVNADLGDRSTNPAAYERVSGLIPPTEMIYTPYNSWRGVAAPSPLPAPFSGEYGNRVHFGLHVVGTPDWDFALADLTWELDSDDVTNYFDQSGDFSSATYSATRVGIDYGPDGVKGGGDDLILNSGQAGTTKVNELIYIGVGDGFFSFEPDAMTDQEDINITLGDILAGCHDPVWGCLVDLTATYTLLDHAGTPVSTSGTVTIEIVPEPSSAILGGLGLLGLGGIARRRR
jgi:MYXO-CTERM domain-containing protein